MNYEQSNVGPGMVPCKPGCRCSDCTTDRLQQRIAELERERDQRIANLQRNNANNLEGWRQSMVLLNRRIAHLERERDEARKLFDAAVQLVHDAGLATGHADDAPSLMSEVLEQVEQIRGQRDEARREAEWWRAGIHGESTVCPEFARFPWENS